MYCVLRSEIGGKPGNRVIFSGEDRRDAVRFCNRYDSEDKLHCQRILKLSILYKNDGTQEALAECLDRNRNAVYTANVSQLVAEGEKKND